MATNITITTSAESTNYTLSTGARGPRGLPGGGDVTSVAGRTGDVTLVSADITDAVSDGNGALFKVLKTDVGGSLTLSSLTLGDTDSQGALLIHAGDGSGNAASITAFNITENRFYFLPDADGTLMIGSNNLSDLTSASTARTNLGLGTGDSPTFDAVTAGASAGAKGFNVGAIGKFIQGFNSLPAIYNGGTAVAHFSATSSIGVLARTFSLQSSVSDGSSSVRFSFSSSGVAKLTTDGASNYASIDLLNLTASGTVSAARLSQTTSTAANPTTTEYPTSGQWGVHKNTSSGDVFLAYNDGGTIKKVQLT